MSRSAKGGSRSAAHEGWRALFLTEGPDGSYLLTSYDPNFAVKLAKADDIIDRYHKTLYVLAK